MTRSEEREQAFILFFEKSFNHDLSAEKILELAYETQAIEKSDFTESLFLTGIKNLDAIDELINKYRKGRSFSRISKVSLAALRLAVCEISYFDDIPVGVSINEAVELSKKYASEDEFAFVNGILGSLVKGEN